MPVKQIFLFSETEDSSERIIKSVIHTHNLQVFEVRYLFVVVLPKNKFIRRQAACKGRIYIVSAILNGDIARAKISLFKRNNPDTEALSNVASDFVSGTI